MKMEYSDWFRCLHGHTGATADYPAGIYIIIILPIQTHILTETVITGTQEQYQIRVFLKLKAQSSKVKKGAEV
jgi:hypothetical protein